MQIIYLDLLPSYPDMNQILMDFVSSVKFRRFLTDRSFLSYPALPFLIFNCKI